MDIEFLLFATGFCLLIPIAIGLIPEEKRGKARVIGFFINALILALVLKEYWTIIDWMPFVYGLIALPFFALYVFAFYGHSLGDEPRKEEKA